MCVNLRYSVPKPPDVWDTIIKKYKANFTDKKKGSFRSPPCYLNADLSAIVTSWNPPTNIPRYNHMPLGTR